MVSRIAPPESDVMFDVKSFSFVATLLALLFVMFFYPIEEEERAEIRY